MTTKLETLEAALREALGTRLHSLTVALGEITLVVKADVYFDAMRIVRDTPALAFDELIDLCGVDYSEYKDGAYVGSRYCVVTHLLSVSLNQRLCLKVFAQDDDMPLVDSITDIWNSANWFEREAFDLFGIVFDGHSDLRRILTDYGFIGHPFRKDFPTNGHVEMRYDEVSKRVVYQPVSIELREITPRIIREEGYGANKAAGVK